MGKLITIPFAALLRVVYGFTQSYGVSIILFALVLKLILLPFQMKSKKSMVRMGRLSKKQEELQKQYGKNQQKYQEELSKLYQEQGVNPMSGCLWSLLPLFFMIPLYSIIYRPITHFMGLTEEIMADISAYAETLGYVAGQGNVAYEQIALTNFMAKNWSAFEGKFDGIINVDFSFLGLDLSATPTNLFSNFSFSWACIGVILIPILAAVSQVISTKIMTKSNGQSEQQAKQMRSMNIMMPLMSLWFCFSMPAAMGVYWIINTVLQTVQEMILGKFFTKKIEAEEDERQAKIDADRKKRQEEGKLKAIEQKEQPKKEKKQPQKPQNTDKNPSTTEAGRVGERPYARGRSYKADRYDDKE